MAGKKMEVERCGLCKKFYDKATYPVCPHCGGSGNIEAPVKQEPEPVKEQPKPVAEEQEKKDKHGFISIFRKDKTKEEESVDKTEPVVDIEPEISNGIGNESTNDDMRTVQEVIDDGEAYETLVEEAPIEEKPVIKTDVQPVKDIGISPVTPSKDTIVKPVHNIPVAKPKDDDDDMRTVHMFSSNTSSEPVVGWFVCVKGECLGDSFEIRSGNNNLGRSTNNDICIDDSSVSREQAIVTFEPRKQNFFIKPKDNSQFMYINDEEVAERTKLEPYMHIEIGEKTEFVFIPLAGEQFNWKDYIEE